MARAFHCRPSDIYRLEHPVLAHDFDTAVWLFGTAVENDLEEAASKVKKPEQQNTVRKLRLAVWLGNESGYAQPTPGKRKAW